MEFREGVGRMVVAARDISSNEIVLVEDPVALSPTQVKKTLFHQPMAFLHYHTGCVY